MVASHVYTFPCLTTLARKSSVAMGASGVRVRESRIWESPAVKSKLRCRSLASQFYADVSGVSRLADASPRLALCIYRCFRAKETPSFAENKRTRVRAWEGRQPPCHKYITLEMKPPRKHGTWHSHARRTRERETRVYHLFNYCLTNIATNFKHRREAYASCWLNYVCFLIRITLEIVFIRRLFNF